MTNKKNELHQLVFDFLEDYRVSHPDFYYFLRERNNKNRLENGIWFQGNETYAFVGLYNRSGGSNMTKSFGLVFWQTEGKIGCNVEIAFNDEQDESILSFYQEAREIIGGFELSAKTKYQKSLSNENGFIEATNFLNLVKPQIDKIIEERKLNKILITEESFNQNLNRVLAYQNINENKTNILLVNITWNSNNWISPSDDPSNHRWVKEGNIPHESWNFDFKNPRNLEGKINGFAQFTHAPDITGSQNLVIFHSQGKIVGFYGNAEFLHQPIKFNENESYNIIGDRDLSIALNNKLENLKEKGYMEDKKRMGQNGFIYLELKETAIKILNEAILLNPEQKQRLEQIKKWLNSSNNQSVKLGINMENNLNQILFGPPGTGKTFHTIDEALKIVDSEFYKSNQGDRDKLTKRFRELLITDWEKPQGQIVFCTFHQSFSYEDFVEGIKPVRPRMGDTYLKYETEAGVFKRICRLSEDNEKGNQLKTKPLVSFSDDEFKKAIFYKVSLGDINDSDDNEIYDYCIKNNCISIGFGGGADFSGLNESQVTAKCIELKLEPFNSHTLNHFIHYLKVDNYVIISKGNRYIRALGKVISPYRFESESPIRDNNFRNVVWIFTDENIPISEIYDRNLKSDTIYKLDEQGIQKDFFVKTALLVDQPIEIEKNYVLVIDEINRGNISSIFGELITLIEKDKRAGAKEELDVILPYSKEPFKVPNNVYLIGTMNTADRSIEALDTALRRRFSFIEISPNHELIKIVGNLAPDGIVDGIDVVKMLETINNRIEKLIDKDHKIGHAYFLHIEKTVEALVQVFTDKIIPLLEEYFFGDFGKIGLVLGENFVEKVNTNGFEFAQFPAYGEMVSDLKERPVYRIRPIDGWDFKSIYETKVLK